MSKFVLHRFAIIFWLALIPVLLIWPWQATPTFYLVNFAAIFVLVVDMLLASNDKNIQINRKLPMNIAQGEAGEVIWTISNNSPKAIRLQFGDCVFPSLNVRTSEFRGVIAAKSKAEFKSTFVPQRRGEFILENVYLRTYGPMSLAGRQVRVPLESRIIVYPSFRSQKQAELRIQKANVLQQGLRVVRSRGGGTEFDSLREYTPDDSFRSIDWNATMRSGKPIVRQFRAERNQTVVVMLDMGRAMAARVGEYPRHDHAMDAILGLTTVASHMGDKIGLVAFDSQIRRVVAPSGGRKAIRSMAHALYPLEPSHLESDYERAISEVLGRFRRRAFVVLLTDLSSSSLEEFILPLLPTLSKHHLVTIATITDPQGESWSRDVPLDPGASYLRTAAVAEKSRLNYLRSIVESQGIRVVHGKPNEFAGVVVDWYMSAKAKMLV